MRQRSQWIYHNAIRRWRDKTRRWHIWSSFFSDGWRGHKYVQSVFSCYIFYFKSSFIFHWVYMPNFSQLSTIAAGRILTNYRSTLEYVASFNRRLWLSPISIVHSYSVAHHYNCKKIPLLAAPHKLFTRSSSNRFEWSRITCLIQGWTSMSSIWNYSSIWKHLLHFGHPASPFQCTKNNLISIFSALTSSAQRKNQKLYY